MANDSFLSNLLKPQPQTQQQGVQSQPSGMAQSQP